MSQIYWLVALVLAVNGAHAEQNVKLIQFTDLLNSSINFEANPCEDFYDYACKNTPNITTDRSAHFDLTWKTRRLDVGTITKILESFFETEDEINLSDVEIKAKEFYVSCRNSRSLSELRNTDIYKSTGGWPALEDNWRMTATRADMLADFSQIQQNYFFSQNIQIQNNKRLIEIFPVLYPKFNLLDYNRTVMETLTEFGVDESKAREIADKLVKFEDERGAIANATDDINQLDDVQPKTFAQFKETFAGLNWAQYFRKIFGKPLKPTDKVIVKNGKVLHEILQLLGESTPEIISNYIWTEYLTGKTDQDCVNLLQHYFHPVYTSIIRRPSYNKFAMLEIFQEIGKGYDQLFELSDCDNHAAKQQSKVYLNRQINILLNGDPKMNLQFDSLRINRRNFYENLENCARHLAKHKKYKTILTEFYRLFQQPSNGFLLNPDSIASMAFGMVGVNLAYEMIGTADSSSSSRNHWCSTRFNSEVFHHAFPEALRSKLRINLSDLSDNLGRNYFAERLAFLALKSWLKTHTERMADRQLEQNLFEAFQNLSNTKLYWAQVAQRRWCSCGHKQFMNSYFKQLFYGEFSHVFQCWVPRVVPIGISRIAPRI